MAKKGSTTQSDPAERHRYVFVKRPRCPDCKKPTLKAYRSTRQDDGSKSQYARCTSCGAKPIIVVIE